MDYFDLHCDTPFECFNRKADFFENNLSVSGKNGDMFEKWHQIFAVWINDSAPNPFDLYRQIIKDFKMKIAGKPQNLTPYFSVEGGAVLEKDVERLHTLKQDGISLLTLTWNGENNIAGGVDTDKGLTDFGKQVIEKMNRLKLVCDLSHLNKKGFFAAADVGDKIVATHSNCYEICPHKRNLTDAQIDIIAQKNGLMGICFYPSFLGGDVFEKIYENIFYLCDKGYENIVAIGSDFDGGEMAFKLNSISKIPELYSFLEQKGLKKDLLQKLFYGNAYNFIANL